MKYLSLIIGMVVVFSASAFFLYEPKPEPIDEDISSYEITNRHECYQIKDNKKYNECLSFYLVKSPYRLDEKLVATRLVE